MSEAIRKFLLPVDASIHSERAFDYYLKNVHRPGDQLQILHVEEQPVLPSNYVVCGPLVHSLSGEWEKEQTERMERSRETLERFKQRCDESGIDCSVQVKAPTDSPGQTICDAAKENGASGIILGSRGLNLIRRTLLGSVSSYVVNHADVPVTVARPPTSE